MHLNSTGIYVSTGQEIYNPNLIPDKFLVSVFFSLMKNAIGFSYKLLKNETIFCR